MTETALDYGAIRKRQRGAWSTGNYSIVGTTLQIVGESLCETLDVQAGSRVLDVAAGNGNATLAAARRFADVTSTDYVPSLLEAGRRRAIAEGLPVYFKEADAEDLPFRDSSYDVVMSTFGVMFTPDQNKAASELTRVCASGGKIGLANWTPDGFVGQMFKTISKYVPPVPGLQSPSLWGTEARVFELFGDSASDIRTTKRDFTFRYRSPEHFVEVFRTYYGPMNKAFASLDAEPERQEEFAMDLLSLVEAGNRSGGRTLALPSEYLEVVIDVM